MRAILIAACLTATSIATALAAGPEEVDARDVMAMRKEAPDFWEHKDIIVKLSARYDEVQYVFSYHYSASQLYVLFINARPEQMEKRSAAYLKKVCGEISSDTSPRCQVRLQTRLTSCSFERGPMLLKNVKTPADAAKASAIITCEGDRFKVLR